MESKKRKVSRVMGLITVICAMGMAILNIIQGKPFDDYIMPVIFLAVGTSFLTRKQTEETVGIKVSAKRHKILLASSFVVFLGGIVTLIITLV